MSPSWTSSSPRLLLSFFVVGIVATVLSGEAAAMNVPEALMNDPRFINCMGEASNPEHPNYMSAFAKCYSFAGRPRFGKRGSNNIQDWSPYYGRSRIYNDI